MGCISAKTLSALGASVPAQPLGRGHLLPPGIPAVSCHSQPEVCPCIWDRVPPFPALSQLQAKSLHACSISGQVMLLVPTASQAEGGCCCTCRELGEVSRPREPFTQSHLPALGTKLGFSMAVTGLERCSNGWYPTSLNIKPTSCSS